MLPEAPDASVYTEKSLGVGTKSSQGSIPLQRTPQLFTMCESMDPEFTT